MSKAFVLCLQDDYESHDVVGVCSSLPRAQRMAAEHLVGVGGEWEPIEGVQPPTWMARTSAKRNGVAGMWELTAIDLTVELDI